MASIARIGIARLGYNNLTRQLCKVISTSNVTQLAFISHKSKRVDRRRIAPFDYFDKKYGFWAQLLDPMVDRIDENSKVIVVDGPIAAGKSKVAAKLAEEFEMIYLPAPTFDEYYITDYGYDIRTLDDKLSVNCQSCDVQRYLTDPYHPNVASCQFHFFMFRLDQYITALLHLLSTGQGVVLNRSIHSDYAFAKAMTNAGYMRPEVLTYYMDVRRIAQIETLKPHLIVYLDVPVNIVKEKIKKRGIPYEVNSKVFTSEYLQDIEDTYKLDYLKNIETHSHVLIYDWAKEGDVSVIVEDIEFLNFDYEDKKAKKMSEWRFENVQDLRTKRCLYIDREMLYYDCIPMDYKLPELSFTATDNIELEQVLKTVPGYKYDLGFNADMGDKNVLWKYVSFSRIGSFRTNARDIVLVREELQKLKTSATL